MKWHGRVRPNVDWRSQCLSLLPEGLVCNKKTLTPAAWITRQPYTHFWCPHVIFVSCRLWCQRLVCSPSSSSFLATRVFQHTAAAAADSSHSSASAGWCCVLGLRGARGVRWGLAGAASRSPRVKGENSENRAFWSAGEDLPAPFCMLEFGLGGPRGRVWDFVRVEMRKRGEKLKISATEDTPRVKDSESVLVLPNFPLCSVIRFCLKGFCMDADTIMPRCFDEASGNCTFLSSGEVFQSCKCTKLLQREHRTLVAIV